MGSDQGRHARRDHQGAWVIERRGVARGGGQLLDAAGGVAARRRGQPPQRRRAELVDRVSAFRELRDALADRGDLREVGDVERGVRCLDQQQQLGRWFPGRVGGLQQQPHGEATVARARLDHPTQAQQVGVNGAVGPRDCVGDQRAGAPRLPGRPRGLRRGGQERGTIGVFRAQLRRTRERGCG